MVKEENKSMKTIVKRLGKNTIAVVLILCGMFGLIIIYLILMFEFYKKRSFIFTPYVVTKPPGSFYVLGTITQLTQEQINERNAFIKANT